VPKLAKLITYLHEHVGDVVAPGREVEVCYRPQTFIEFQGVEVEALTLVHLELGPLTLPFTLTHEGVRRVYRLDLTDPKLYDRLAKIMTWPQLDPGMGSIGMRSIKVPPVMEVRATFRNDLTEAVQFNVSFTQVTI